MLNYFYKNHYLSYELNSLNDLSESNSLNWFYTNYFFNSQFHSTEALATQESGQINTFQSNFSSIASVPANTNTDVSVTQIPDFGQGPGYVGGSYIQEFVITSDSNAYALFHGWNGGDSGVAKIDTSSAILSSEFRLNSVSRFLFPQLFPHQISLLKNSFS
jgi:hypothetical protein